MADVNLLDIFFDGGNTMSHLEKDITQKKDDENLDWISDDFLDSILKTCPVEDGTLLDPFLITDSASLNAFNLDCSSDSGLSYGQDASPGRSIGIEDDLCLNDALVEADSLMRNIRDTKPENNEPSTISDDSCEMLSFDSVDYVKEEEVECEEVFDSAYFVNTDSPDASHQAFIIQDINTSDDDSNDVQSVHFSSENSVSDPKEEPLEIEQCLGSRIRRAKDSNYSNVQRLQKKRKFSDALEENTSDDSDVLHLRLNLTPEEHKLAMKEGIKLPSHYPLTKIEERELKRIRRKIRNKISAQDSRRRKKEYVDGLEERVKRTSDENADLIKRLKTLESQKMTLVAQVKKLQASLARCSGQTAPSSTCLLVFIMSLALILAPNLRNSPVSSDNVEDEGISLTEESQSEPSSPGRSSSRNLLFTQKNLEEQTNFTEEAKMLTEQLEKMQLPDAHVLSSVLEMLKLGNSDSLLKDHDYFRPRKRLAAEILGEESWPLPTKLWTRMASELKNVASTFVIEKKKEQHTKEPVIIDLLSD